METDPGRDPRADLIDRLGARFEVVGEWSFDHRWLVLVLCLLLLGVSAWLATQTRFDNSVEAFFDTSDETYAAYTKFREDFGSDEISYLVYEAPDREHGPFDLEVMRRIHALTEALEEEVPFVKQVTSLTNVEFIEGVPDGLEIYELLEELPEDQEQLLVVRDKVLGKPLYVGGLVSEDARHAAIVIEMDRSTVDPVEELRLDPDAGDAIDNLYPQVSYAAIEQILARPEYAGIEFHHVGDVPLNAIYNEVIASESEKLMGLSFLAIGLLLLFFFRSFVGVIGPMLVVALSLVVSIGAIGLMGWKLDLMFIMLPVLLIAVGVADGVHIIAEFRTFHAELGDRRAAAARTLRLVGVPCLLTSLTTAAAFASMSVAPIESIAHLGLYSAVGVLAAFLLSVTLLMVLLSFGRREVGREASADEIVRAKGGRFFQSVLESVAELDLRARRSIIAVSLALLAVSVLGMTQLRVDSNFMHEFSPEEPVRMETEYVDGVMGGTLSLVYLFDAGEAEGVKDPGVLAAMEALQNEAELSPTVQRTSSVGDLLKDINQSFHAEDPAYYALPEERDLVGQYLLLYEMSGGEELGDYVSGDLARGRVDLRCKTVETSQLQRLEARVREHLEESPLRSASVSMTGVGALWLKLQEYITRSQILGFSVAFSVIAVMLCVLFRSVPTGLIAMVPNLAPVVLTLGAMGWLDLPLDYIRLFIASVAIGISVDDTIHHMTRFRLEFRRCGSYEQALRASMSDVGRALVITSIVLVVGFLVFTFSRLDTYLTFGALLAGTITVALVADFLLVPALVLTFKPFGPEGARAQVRNFRNGQKEAA